MNNTQIKNTLQTRYQSAYNVARTFKALGSLIQLLGILFAAFTLITTYIRLEELGTPARLAGSLPLPLGMLLATGILYTLVAAVGAVLKSSLDIAVNTSPLLENEDRVKIMKLV